MKHLLLIFIILFISGYGALANEKALLASERFDAETFVPKDFEVRNLTRSFTNNGKAETIVQGIVTAQDSDEGLPGVNVLIKGEDAGTVTDIDGNYAITIADPQNTVLVFSYIGYLTEEIAVNGRSTIDVELVPDILSLNEVVVVGYGTQEKRKLTGSISSLESKTISQNINADPVTSLQGQSAGVQVTQASGQPGGAIRVRVRGSASLLSGGDPLVVVDGIPIITSTFGSNPNDGISGLAEINPNDIESMEVLKDGAAAAIYGSRAANGVILITTKKGTPGRSNVSVDFQTGVNVPTNRIELLNSSELRAVNLRAWENSVFSGTGAKQYFPVPEDVDGYQGFNEEVAANTDVNWLDEVLRDGTFRNFNFSATTGSDKTTALVSLGYRDEEGIEIGRDFTRANARLNIDHRPNTKMDIGMNMSLAYVRRNNPGNHFGTAQSNALPFFPIFRPNEPTLLFNGFNENSNSVGTNPIFFRNNYSDLTTTYRSISNVFANYKLFPGLEIRTEWGIDYQNNVNDSKRSAELFPASVGNVGGNGRTNTRRFSAIAWNANNTISYSKSFANDHNLDVLIGNSILNQDNQGQTFVFEGLTFPSLPIATTYDRTSNSISQFRFVSLFSRINYDYKGKYLAQFSVRRDGSSRFGPGRRYGNFGGGSFGWIFSEENFFSENVGFINYGKLRASYGTIGNAELPTDFLSISLADVNDSEIGYAEFRGVAFGRIGNENLSWETTRQFNIGLNLGFLDNRLDVTLDYYDKLSENLLLESRLANSTGYLDRNYVFNVGSIRNTGVELAINSINIEREGLTWSSSFNISHNVGKVEQLTPPVNADDTKIRFFNTGSVQLVEGGNFGSYFLPISAGVDPTTGNELIKEVDQVYLEETGIARLTGNVLDAEVLGGDINNHRMVLQDKTAIPDFFGGLNNSFTYKGLSLDILFYFQFGNYILDTGERAQSYPGEQRSLRSNMINGLDLPQGEFSQTDPLIYDSRISGINTTRFLHDGSFVRLRNVKLGYDFRNLLLNAESTISNITVYVSGQNLLTFTRFPGWDPEVFNGGGNSQQANAGPGTIGFNLPQVRTVLVGVNIGF